MTAATKTQNFTQFCTARGLTTDADVSSHIHCGLKSMPQTKTWARWNEQTTNRLLAEREAARALYQQALARGEVVAPPAITLAQRAAGLPDQDSTQAAVRLLAKIAARKALATT